MAALAEYTVYFELYGKKMKTTIMATSEEAAKEKVINSVKIYSVKKPNTSFNNCMDMLNKLGGK